MSREIDAHQRTLFVEAFQSSPFLSFWYRGLLQLDVIHPKERELCFVLSLLELLSVAHKQVGEDVALLIHSNNLLATNVSCNRVESSAQSKTFHSVALDGREIDAFSKVEDVLEGSVLLSLVDDGLHSSFAKSFDGGQTITDLLTVVDTKVEV